jgi:hypothetical protein
MLQDGGMLVKPGFGGKRQGYKVDTGDLGSEAANEAASKSASRDRRGDRRDDYLSNQFKPSVTKGTLSDPREKQDFFEKPSKFNFLDFVPGIGTIRRIASVFGPLDNKKFFEDKVKPSLLDRGMKVPTFKNYMKARMANQIDAYGNPINQDDDDNNILLPQGIMTQAPSITEPEPEPKKEDDSLFRRFRANGGMSLQDAKDMAPEGEFLAYINNKEADMLKKAGGSGIMTKAGIPSFVEYGGQSGFESAKSTGSVQGDVDRGRGDRPTTPTGGGKTPQTFQMVNPTFNKALFEDELKLQNLIDKIELENRLKEEEEEDQTITAGAVDASDFIRNMPEFKQKISDTVSGIMANPDIANLGKTEFAVGGLADGNFDFENARQMYGLGKLVKKVTRTVKKIAKSPVGKAALLYAGGAGLGALGTGTGFAGFKAGLMSPSLMFRNLATSGKGFLTGITGGAIQFPGAAVASNAPGAFKLGEFFGSPLGAITGATALAGLLTPKQEEEAQALADETGIDIEQARNSILARARDDYKMDFRARGFRAEGGIMRAGYQEGSKEPVAKKTMPLLDMDGKEMDLREEGGFVPIGRMEKADDVPARLSKNEFVFTADAVRNAGDGDVDKGAEVMYNMMKNLESGGDVSEESQGLEGARRMFQTSQRLEEVL